MSCLPFYYAKNEALAIVWQEVVKSLASGDTATQFTLSEVASFDE